MLQPTSASGPDPDPSIAPPTWPEGCFSLFHQVWGDVAAGKPYDRTQKLKFARLLEGLELVRRRTDRLDGVLFGRRPSEVP